MFRSITSRPRPPTIWICSGIIDTCEITFWCSLWWEIREIWIIYNCVICVCGFLISCYYCGYLPYWWIAGYEIIDEGRGVMSTFLRGICRISKRRYYDVVTIPVFIACSEEKVDVNSRKETEASE